MDLPLDFTQTLTVSKTGWYLLSFDAVATVDGEYRTWFTIDGRRDKSTDQITLAREGVAVEIRHRAFAVKLEAGQTVAVRGMVAAPLQRMRFLVRPQVVD